MLIVCVEGVLCMFEDVCEVVVVSCDGVLVCVGDVVEVCYGVFICYGVVICDGEGEVVEGLVVGLCGVDV